MKEFLRILLVLVTVLVLPAGQVWAVELTVIVNRVTNSDITDIFLHLPATAIETVLGTDPKLVFSENGDAPIDEFRSAGNFELAGDVFAKLNLRSRRQKLLLSPMSLMLHPKDMVMPFRTPLDGLLAISTCTVPTGSTDLDAGALGLYHGTSIKDPTGVKTFDLTFPKTGREPIDVTVYHYIGGKFIETERLKLLDGGLLQLHANASGQTLLLNFGIGLFPALAFLTLAFGTGGRLRISVIPKKAPAFLA